MFNFEHVVQFFHAVWVMSMSASNAMLHLQYREISA